MSGSAALAGARRRRAAPPPTAAPGSRPQTQPQSQTQLLAQQSSQLPVHAQNPFPMASNGLSQGLTGQMSGPIAYNPNLPLPPGIRGPASGVNVGQPQVPMSVPSMAGGPPPIMVLKGHDDKLKDHEGAINDVSNRLNHLNSRLDKLEEDFNQFFDGNGGEGEGQDTAVEGEGTASSNAGGMLDDQAYAELCSDLIDNRDFMSGIVDKIVNDTNLSEVIKQIEPVVVENRELRSLIHSQQEMLNHMSSLVYKLLNDNATVANAPTVITYVPPPRVSAATAAADNDGPTFSTLAPIVSAPVVSAPIISAPVVSSSSGVSDYEPSSYIEQQEQDLTQDQDQDQDQDQEHDEENSGTVKLEVTHNDVDAEHQGTDV